MTFTGADVIASSLDRASLAIWCATDLTKPAAARVDQIAIAREALKLAAARLDFEEGLLNQTSMDPDGGGEEPLAERAT